MRLFFVCAMMFFITVGSSPVANTAWKKYCNGRFPYCLEYPDFLTAQPEAANGDGRFFTDAQGNEVMWVYGTINMDSETGEPVSLAKQFMRDNTSHDLDRITYSKTGDRYYVLSGYKGDQIYYQKTLWGEESLCYAILQYPRKDAARYDPVVQQLFKTFLLTPEE